MKYCDVCKREVPKAEERVLAGVRLSVCPYHSRRLFAFHPFIYVDGVDVETADELLNDSGIVKVFCRHNPLEDEFAEDYMVMLSILRHASNALYKGEKTGLFFVLNSPLTVSSWLGGIPQDLTRNFIRPAVWVNAMDYQIRIGDKVMGIRRFINSLTKQFPPTEVFQYRSLPSDERGVSNMLNMAWNLWRRQHENYLERRRRKNENED